MNLMFKSYNKKIMYNKIIFVLACDIFSVTQSNEIGDEEDIIFPFTITSFFHINI